MEDQTQSSLVTSSKGADGNVDSSPAASSGMSLERSSPPPPPPQSAPGLVGPHSPPPPPPASPPPPRAPDAATPDRSPEQEDGASGTPTIWGASTGLGRGSYSEKYSWMGQPGLTFEREGRPLADIGTGGDRAKSDPSSVDSSQEEDSLERLTPESPFEVLAEAQEKESHPAQEHLPGLEEPLLAGGTAGGGREEGGAVPGPEGAKWNFLSGDQSPRHPEAREEVPGSESGPRVEEQEEVESSTPVETCLPPTTLPESSGPGPWDKDVSVTGFAVTLGQRPVTGPSEAVAFPSVGAEVCAVPPITHRHAENLDQASKAKTVNDRGSGSETHHGRPVGGPWSPREEFSPLSINDTTAVWCPAALNNAQPEPLKADGSGRSRHVAAEVLKGPQGSQLLAPKVAATMGPPGILQNEDLVSFEVAWEQGVGAGEAGAVSPESRGAEVDGSQPGDGHTSQPEDQTELGRDSQPEDQTGLGRDSQPCDQTELGRDSQPEDQIGWGRDSQPEDQTELGRDSQPEDQTGLGRDSQPEDQTGLGRDSQPGDQTELGRDSQPEDQTGLGRASQPEDQTELGRDSQLEDQTGLGRDSQPEDQMGLGRDSQLEDQIELGRDSQPEDQTGLGRVSQPGDQTELGRDSQPMDEAGVPAHRLEGTATGEVVGLVGGRIGPSAPAALPPLSAGTGPAKGHQPAAAEEQKASTEGLPDSSALEKPSLELGDMSSPLLEMIRRSEMQRGLLAREQRETPAPVTAQPAVIKSTPAPVVPDVTGRPEPSRSPPSAEGGGGVALGERASPPAPREPPPEPSPAGGQENQETPEEVVGGEAAERESRTTVKDLIYWTDPKKSGLVFGSTLTLLVSLAVFSVVSVLAYLVLALLSVTISYRVYKSVIEAVQKTNEGNPFRAYLEKDITMSQEAFCKHCNTTLVHVNSVLKYLLQLFLVQDLVDSLKLAILMWLMTYVGAVFNGLTLLILALLLTFTVPAVYKKYQTEIDHYVQMVQKQISCATSKIQEKLPGTKRKTE